MTERTIEVDYLARVEGEGALYVRLEGDEVADVKLKIFEPPRFFEAFLRGRRFTEVPDITARICGICPIAYQMSSCHAMEQALGVKVDGALRELRRLIYCGEWIESHTLHVYMLHAPDFLGYQDAIQMAADHPDVVKSGLEMKKTGNDIVNVVGGREIHPINVRVGGFYKLPDVDRLNALVPRLERAREIASDAGRLVASFDYPDFEMDYEFVALREGSEYPFNEGRIVSNKGLDIDIKDFADHFSELHVEHSNALHSMRIPQETPYHVGPLARYALNQDLLSTSARDLAKEIGLGPVENNPFRSILVRCVETLYACDEALRIIKEYEPPQRPFVPIEPGPGVGWGCTEAPRGILYHRYELDDDGLITDAQIVPPTSQNQMMIEQDLWHYIEKAKHLPDDELTWQCEQAIRNYDPCISCATHFLDLQVDRR